MNTRYVAILEKRLLWAAMWLRTSKGVKSDAEIATYLAPLVNGELVVVEPEFCDLAYYAKNTVPDDLEFEESWLPSENGFIWLSKPYELPKIRGGLAAAVKLQIQAIGWSVRKDGWQFSIYATTNDLQTVSMFAPWSWFGLKNGDKLNERVNGYEEHATEEDHGDAYVLSHREMELSHEIRVVYTLLHLMNQKVAAHSRETASSLVRRMVERKTSVQGRANMDVRVITLRRQAVEGHAEASREVDWHCRWIVGGHWRLQPYKTTGKVKRIFIAAYVKGPADKPLSAPPSKVYVARR